MKKDKEENKVFNILETPFGDGLEVKFTEEFSDDFKEDISVEKEVISDFKNEEEEVLDETKEVTKEVAKDLPKKEVEVEKPEVVNEPKGNIETEESSTLKTFASWLGDQGLVDYNEEEFEDSEEGLKKLMSSTVEREVEKYKQSLPEDVHKLVEFVESGGDPKQFLEAYYKDHSWNDFEIEDEKDAKVVLKEYLKAQGEDDEDINETLDTYEVSGILEKKAKTALNKLQAYEKSYQEQLVEQQKKYDAEQKILVKKQFDEFKDRLYSKEDIQGFKLTPKVKDDLWNFMMKPDKDGKTGLQKHHETNENAQFMYAYLAMNNWDISKLEKQVKNKVSSDLASKLSNFKNDSRSKLKSGQSDGFSGERKNTSFSAFRQAINNNLI